MEASFMREAIRLSLQTMRRKRGGPFGAVIVRAGKVIGRGWNEVPSANDPTAHAEIMAIRKACQRLKTFRLEGCELYASCEPCPMCLAAVYWSHLDKLYFANTRKDAARIGFDDDYLYRQVALPASRRELLMKQILHDEAQRAFREWQRATDKVRY